MSYEDNLQKGIELAKEFERMRNMGELKALSNYSLEHPLTDSQFKRMMELKEVLK